ncbi:phosphatidate cytidylyltransferase, mitochondrial-like [Lutzomyia longipalpis]|nr:phosphatidate cytidylyltransferase, mitochondrial-like [Lutzomyia longipalpis]
MSSMSAGLDLCRRILKRFPRNVCFSFAYGSGVKSQIGYEKKNLNENIIDFVLCVPDDKMKDWHKENIQRNPQDYSGMRFLSPSMLVNYQTSIPANVYCNTLIPIEEEGVMIKYGVTRESDLIKDATEWKDLYLSGRLHKPVQFLQEPDETLREALRKNLQTALTVGLLLLPERFTNFQLFHTIASLSYSGDFRMIFGENPNKVSNIVKPQIESFFKLYQPLIIHHQKHLQCPESLNGEYIQDKSSKIVENQLNSIPFIYPRELIGRSGNTKNYKEELREILRRRVFKSSALQSIKNIPTAGLVKSLKYSYKKTLKMDDDEMAFGPALPPHLLKSSSAQSSSPVEEKKVIGPCLPPNFQPQEITEVEETVEDEEDEDDLAIGPLLPGQEPQSRAQLELEERALEIKLNGLEGSERSTNDATNREEWMIELPEVRKVADLGLGPRQFRQKEGPDFSDRSSWTDTPQSKLEKEKTKSKEDTSRKSYEEKLIKERDRAMEKLKKKYDKEHKREKSLLELHQDKLKKKKKKSKEKEERRPFSREVDLAVNKFDETRKQAATKKSKQLDTKFSAGSSKFL